MLRPSEGVCTTQSAVTSDQGMKVPHTLLNACRVNTPLPSLKGGKKISQASMPQLVWGNDTIALPLMTLRKSHMYPRTTWLCRADLMISKVIDQDEESAGLTFLIIALREGTGQRAMFSLYFSLEEPRMNWTVIKEKGIFREGDLLSLRTVYIFQSSVTACSNNL